MTYPDHKDMRLILAVGAIFGLIAQATGGDSLAWFLTGVYVAVLGTWQAAREAGDA